MKHASKDELSSIGVTLGDEPGRTDPGQGPSPKTASVDVSSAPGADGADETLDVRALAEDMASGAWEFLFDEVTDALPFIRFDEPAPRRTGSARVDAALHDKAVARTTPVLVKYWDKMPAWFTKYQEEFALGFFVAGLIWGGYKQYQAAAAAAQRKAATDAASEAEGPAAAGPQ